MSARRDGFITVHYEGALLPPDFLQMVAEGHKDVPGPSPADYHLQEREKRSEAITRSWNRLLGFWAAFQSASAALKESDAATGLTRDKWLLPLFQELAYGRLPAGKGFVIDDKPYPISHPAPVTIGRGSDFRTLRAPLLISCGHPPDWSRRAHLLVVDLHRPGRAPCGGRTPAPTNGP